MDNSSPDKVNRRPDGRIVGVIPFVSDSIAFDFIHDEFDVSRASPVPSEEEH